MSEDSLSPGPWSYTWGDNGRYEVRDANGRTVAEVRNEADARLIATGPEIHCCLENLVASVRIQPIGTFREPLPVGKYLEDAVRLLARMSARSPWTGGDG